MGSHEITALLGKGGMYVGRPLCWSASGVNRNRPALQSFLQRLAINQLHDNATRTTGPLESVYLSDVGMIQRSENFRLPLKAAHTAGVARKLIGQDFDRNLAFESRARYTSPMPPLPSHAGDLMRTDACADRDSH